MGHCLFVGRKCRHEDVVFLPAKTVPVNILKAETFPLESQQLIEASAGTGKTYTITNLYLRLLLGHSKSMKRPLAVNEILVLTFTIAATEELRHRIRNRIVDARQSFVFGQSDDPFLQYLIDASGDERRDRRLLAAAVQMMDEASIFTIHGFCARVLQEQSFDTGMLFDQNLDGDREQLLLMATEDCFRQEILTLPLFDRNLALKIWPNPGRLLLGVRGFLFRQELTMFPAAADTSVKQEELVDTMLAVKRIWVEDNLPVLIREAGFKANTNSFRKIDEMTQLCMQDGVPDPESALWEHWCATKLEKNIKSGCRVPAHPCLTLIEQIYQSGNLVEAIKSGLWQRIIRKVLFNLNKYKTDANQLTLDDLLSQLNRAVTTNEAFAAHLAKLYPCALVDEFQDTDDIQYGIFKAIYNRPGNQSLILIGDPKQAIYQFRGADVFTYINAKRDTGDKVHSLEINWRSSEPLIEAVNLLFNKPDIFNNDSDIPFTKVKVPERPPGKPAEGSSKGQILINGAAQKPFSLTLAGQGKKPLRKDEAQKLVMAHAAEDVSRLLILSAKGEAIINGAPIDAGQIAFLVRSRSDASAARDALAMRNIRSVFVTLESVFLQDTANDLALILHAALEPTNNRAIKAALATSLLQSSISEIDSLNHNIVLQQQVTQEFLDYHQLWLTRDIAPMIDSLLVRRRIAEKWLGHPDGERQLTNLRHLAELLQQRSNTAPGMHRLLKWFIREKSAAESVAGEERQLRLESDENLVKIVTMHAAKGLEYDIVYIPFGAFYRNINRQEPALFHIETSDGFETCLELGSDNSHRAQAQTENLAEDMRLLYVAMTRAKYHCNLGIPNVRDLPNSALARLLGIQEAKSDATAIFEVLSGYPEALFSIALISESGCTRQGEKESISSLVPPPERPDIKGYWRLHSYTGVSRLIKTQDLSGSAVTIPGYGDDDSETDTGSRGEQFDRFSFPRGAKVGIALHSLLEELDFAADENTKRRQCTRCLNEIGIIEDQDKWLPMLLGWLDDILQTPLRDSDCFCLADISRQNRMDELEFHFPLDADANFLDVLQKEGYLQSAQQFVVPKLEGMMTGLIDLVIRHKNQYFLIDYKSNHLGDTENHYSAEPLIHAVGEHQYDLQYLIYCVALNRYLSSRLSDYDYKKQFGGVIYLFLRGMNGRDQSGIYFDKPDEQLLQAFDQALGDSG